jgi:hypothetical protein
VPYREYLDFLHRCKSKKYETELVLHQHHVIPKFIDIDRKYRNQVVLLSVDDHITAHNMLALCFDSGSREQIGNLRALKLLSRDSIKYREQLKQVYESQRGDGNPAKLPENREKISLGVRRFYELNENPKKGKSYFEIYGEFANEEKQKRSKCTRTLEQYKESAKKTAERNRGRVTHNATPVYFQQVHYRSILEASRKTNISIYRIKQQLKKNI